MTPLVIPLVESAWYPCQSYQTKELKYIAIFCCEHGSFEEILKSCGPFVTIVHKIERPSLAHIKGNRKKSTSVFTCVTRKHWHLWGGGGLHPLHQLSTLFNISRWIARDGLNLLVLLGHPATKSHPQFAKRKKNDWKSLV